MKQYCEGAHFLSQTTFEWIDRWCVVNMWMGLKWGVAWLWLPHLESRILGQFSGQRFPRSVGWEEATPNIASRHQLRAFTAMNLKPANSANLDLLERKPKKQQLADSYLRVNYSALCLTSVSFLLNSFRPLLCWFAFLSHERTTAGEPPRYWQGSPRWEAVRKGLVKGRTWRLGRYYNYWKSDCLASLFWWAG